MTGAPDPEPGWGGALSLLLWPIHWQPSWDPQTNAQKLPGEFWVTFADIKTLLANQGDVTVLHGVGMA